MLADHGWEPPPAGRAKVVDRRPDIAYLVLDHRLSRIGNAEDLHLHPQPLEREDLVQDERL